jgi:hypothetical protein
MREEEGYVSAIKVVSSGFGEEEVREYLEHQPEVTR